MDAEARAVTQDWMALQRSLIDLRVQIADADQPDERAALVAKLKETRATIASFESGGSAEAPSSEPEPARPEPANPEPEPADPVPEPPRAPAVATTSPSSVDGPASGRGRRLLAVAAAAVVTIGVAALALSQLDTSPEDPVGSDTQATASDSDAQLGRPEASDVATDSRDQPVAGSQEPALRVSLYDHRFVAQGRTSTSQAMTALEASAANVFGERASVEVQIDEALSSPPWLAAAPDLASYLPLMIEGEIIVTADQTVVSGRATASNLSQLSEMLEAAGFPPLSLYVEVVDEHPPSLIARRDGDKVTVRGTLPDEAMRNIVGADLVATFGQANVVIDVDLDNTLNAEAAVASFGADLAALEAFDNIEMTLIDGSRSIVLNRGLHFEPGDATIDPADTRNLKPVADLALRSAGPISVDGYTDASGSHDQNLVVSLRRANAVAGVLMGAGVDASRISTAGLGDHDPIVSNGTAAGRARNRRIVISIG